MPDRNIRNKNLKQRYGITIDQFESMYEEQEGECASCHRYSESLVVDHDHCSGAVRGLLCYSCNTGIGKLGDNLEGLTDAILYLARFHNREKLNAA